MKSNVKDAKHFSHSNLLFPVRDFDRGHRMGNQARAAPMGSEIVPAARRPPSGPRAGTGAAKSSSSSSAVPWWSRHPEAKRRRRVAGYKAYAVERKVRISLRRGLHWFKDLVHGR